jgi:hypothetical protein
MGSPFDVGPPSTYFEAPPAVDAQASPFGPPPEPALAPSAAPFTSTWSPPALTAAGTLAPVPPPPEPPPVAPAIGTAEPSPVAALAPIVPAVPGFFADSNPAPAGERQPPAAGSPFGAGPLWPAAQTAAPGVMSDEVAVSRAFEALSSPPASPPSVRADEPAAVPGVPPPGVETRAPTVAPAPAAVAAIPVVLGTPSRVAAPETSQAPAREARPHRPPALAFPPPLSPRVPASPPRPPPLDPGAPSPRLPPLDPPPSVVLRTPPSAETSSPSPQPPAPAGAGTPVQTAAAEYAREPEPLGPPITSPEEPVLLEQARSPAPGVLRFNAAAGDSEAPSIGQAAVTGPTSASSRPSADLWVPPVAAGLHAPDPTPTPAPRVVRRSMHAELDDDFEASLRPRRSGRLVLLGLVVLAAAAGAFYVLGPGRHRGDEPAATADTSKSGEAGLARVDPDAPSASPEEDKPDVKDRRHPRGHGSRARSTPKVTAPAPSRGGSTRQPPPPAAAPVAPVRGQAAPPPPAPAGSRATAPAPVLPPAAVASPLSPGTSASPRPAAGQPSAVRPGASTGSSPAPAPSTGATARPAPPPGGASAAPPPAAATTPPPAPTGDSYEIASEYLRQKKVQLAIDELKKAVARNPRDARSYRLMGMAYSLLGADRSSVEAFERFVQLDPTHKDVPKVKAIIADFYKRHPR